MNGSPAHALRSLGRSKPAENGSDSDSDSATSLLPFAIFARLRQTEYRPFVNSFASKMVSCAVLLLAAITLSACPDKEGDCQSCEAPRQPYRCAVGSTNNIVCAANDAQAAVLCPEGATPVNCDGGSGGQAATPESKALDAKLDSKAK